MPRGLAQNLVVLVHGCCTNETDVWEWRALADQIVGEIIDSNPSLVWEVVVWDWTQYTPTTEPETDPQNLVKDATAAYIGASDPSEKYGSPAQAGHGQGRILAGAINRNNYNYIHLVGHSSGAKLVHEAAKVIADFNKTKSDAAKPFIFQTFLDAYTPPDQSFLGKSSTTITATCKVIHSRGILQNIMSTSAYSSLTRSFHMPLTLT